MLAKDMHAIFLFFVALGWLIMAIDHWGLTLEDYALEPFEWVILAIHFFRTALNLDYCFLNPPFYAHLLKVQNS